MLERRSVARVPVEMFFNKFLGGHPYLCRSLNLSSRGVLAQTFVEPEQTGESFALELRMPDSAESVWVWARDAGRRAGCQAIEFLSIDGPGHERIARFLERTAQ